MRITEIRDDVVPIASEIRNAYISFATMTVSAVAVVTDVVRDGRPVVGYGFNSNGRYAQQGILRDRIIPRLLAADPAGLRDDARENFDPHKAWRVMMADEKPGGHGERSVAVGVLDMALWDLVAKIEGKPLYRLLADRYRDGEADSDVWVYAAGGYYYPGKDIEQLVVEMQRYLDLGYRTVKIKIGGATLAEDLRRIEAVLAAIGSGCRLAVDANGRFDLPTALEYANALAAYDLQWYEEAGDPLDYELNAAVAAASKNPIATGENLFSLPDARNLIRHGGMNPERDWLQFDPALSYGLVEYLRTLAMLRQYGWSPRRCVPHGGHQFALHLAAGLGLGGNESYPGVFEPFGGFADDVPVKNGRIGLPEIPGIGVEAKQSLRDVYARLF
jgi:L-alanine-DL-glutamate epimerase-like enolase superfamily enzyme